MNCKTHPDVPAVDRCVGCAETFCANCLVDLQGQKYCGACKVMALPRGGRVLEEATEPCPEAGEALKYAIIGIFCFGFILGPVAVSKAVKARKLIEENPRLTGSGKATAAIVVGSIAFALWLLSMLLRASNMSRLR